jgi:small subunit ribosomal protein S4
MGDPKKLRKKYETPSHPWSRIRIEEERILKKDYGLVNKKEIWRMGSLLKNFKAQVKKLSAVNTPQAEKEKANLLQRLRKIGLLSETSTLGEVLGLTTKDVMERRLQTLVYRKGFAKSVKQARQFITHKHILVGDRKITAPSYIVAVAEEDIISFSKNSPFSDAEHPELKSVKKQKAPSAAPKKDDRRRREVRPKRRRQPQGK